MPSNPRRALSCPRASSSASRTATPQADPEDDDQTPQCGWFDSSHDLQTGLLVQEHASTDAVLAMLDLDDWLRLQLVDWRPPGLAPRH
jgi:hypothetical protein